MPSPVLPSCHLLANHERRALVAEVGHVAEHLVSLGAEGGLKVLDAVEVQDGLDSEGRLGVGVRGADELVDRVALEVVGPKLLFHHGHVRLEVVVHVEGRVGFVGVEDGDLGIGHCYGGVRWDGMGLGREWGLVSYVTRLGVEEKEADEFLL